MFTKRLDALETRIHAEMSASEARILAAIRGNVGQSPAKPDAKSPANPAAGSPSTSASPATLPRTTCLDPAHPCPGSFQYIPPLPSINQSLSTPALPFTLPPFSQSDIDSCKQQWDAIKVQTKGINGFGNRQNPKSSHREDLTIFERYFSRRARSCLKASISKWVPSMA